MNNLVVILHNRLSGHPTPDEYDVLDQVNLVKGALTELGYTCLVRDSGTELYRDIVEIKNLSPVFVFNLIETVFGRSPRHHAADDDAMPTGISGGCVASVDGGDML